MMILKLLLLCLYELLIGARGINNHRDVFNIRENFEDEMLVERCDVSFLDR
jgi:hypothetical protein